MRTLHFNYPEKNRKFAAVFFRQKAIGKRQQEFHGLVIIWGNPNVKMYSLKAL